MVARRSPLVLVALGALAACRPAPAERPQALHSSDLELQVAALEQRLSMLEKLLGAREAAASSGEPLPADSIERVARLEQRLDKVIGFLRQAVRPEVDTTQVYAIPVDPLDPTMGPADAPITLIEAYEFLCPYCSMMQPTIDKLRAAYPTTLRVVSKYLVIHGPPALPAGLAACAAGRQGKYDAMSARLWPAIWPTPNAPDRSQAEEAAVEQQAVAIGLDLKRYRADVAGPCTRWIEDSAAVLDRFGVSGTPTVIINGRYIEERDYAGLKAAIDAELSRVRTSGVPAARYYRDVILAKGKPAAVMISPFD